ncbi:MAG: insulinase family protein [Bacteroidales bacterium]|nr:insulinase family protein [Bacteroidales bacterium]
MRKIQPEIKQIEKINLNEPEKLFLNNGIPVYSIKSGTQDVVKIDLFFEAGSIRQQKPFVAFSANMLLKEGSSKYTSSVIAELLDYHGAYIETINQKDLAIVSLYSLNKHLEKLLPLLSDIIFSPKYPEKEFDVFIQKQRQEYKVNIEKVKYLAMQKFNQLIFGKNNPYGQIVELNDFDTLKPFDLRNFHKRFYDAANCKIIISGKINDKLFGLLNLNFGNIKVNSKYKIDTVKIDIPSITDRKDIIIKENAMQSAIRIGKILFNKTHPDFMGLTVLNTVLGGYFGSRLMMNIREDKGYTYGIGSGLASLHNSGFFFIASEVGTEVSKDAINEIYIELRKLTEEKIPEDELDLVRNYMLGSFMRSIDGPFALAEKYRSVLEYNLDLKYYSKLIETIKSITSSDLLNLAQKYFIEDTMIELLVGK